MSTDVGMEFGIEKCVQLVIKRGKVITSETIQLSDGKIVNSLEEDQSYKYLRILECDKVQEWFWDQNSMMATRSLQSKLGLFHLYVTHEHSLRGDVKS